MFDFPATVADLESVPEKYRVLYSRDGDEGDFTLDDGVAGLATSVANLNRTNRTIRTERDAAFKVTKAMKDAGFETWDDVTTRIGELETQASKGAGAEEQVARVRADLEQTHARQMQEKDDRVQTLTNQLQSQIVGRAALEAISEEKGKPKLLLPVLSQRLRMVEEEGQFRAQVVGDDGQPILDGRGGELSIKGYVAKLKADPDYGDAFEASGNNGSGSNPGQQRGGGNGGPNPFAKETRNLTEAQNLIATKPDHARALAQQAGYPVTW